ncbi:MAG: M61 family peptidase [Acidobacteriota bacterium]
MRRPRLRHLRLLALTLIAGALAPALAPAATPLKLDVDLTEAARRIVHARMSLPVSPGPLTLLYPKWLPGEHGPTGPVTDLAGLHLTAGGTELSWTRDATDMFVFHCFVPEGARRLDVALDYLSPAGTDGFSSGASSTENLAVLSWNQVLIYPQGTPADDLMLVPSVRLPDGWQFATALSTARQEGGEVTFEPVSLTTLVDSPLLAGRYFRTLDLATTVTPRHRMHIAADSAAALNMPTPTRQAYDRLVEQAGRLFGTHHYGSYDFLLTLSDHVARFGLEHHESSDDRSWELALTDPDRRMLMSGLLPHELVHSWNGKYRRPVGLATGGFAKPMKTDMLWVYEGLTTYLGDLLTARSGLWTPEQYRENLALDAATVAHHTGRAWRPLEDTATAAQLLYEARDDWASSRRGVDFYPEGGLIWLEADTLIRQQTGGRRSLDDFCKLFFGGSGGRPEIVPYSVDDLTGTLEEIAPADWKSFFATRIKQVQPRAPLAGVEASGWHLAYTDELPERIRAQQEVNKVTDLTDSIGLTLDEDGHVKDVVPGLPAAAAGIAPGMQLTAVNGRRWSATLIDQALRDAAGGSPLNFLMENGEFFRTFLVDYTGGPRYPHLERLPDRPDLLGQILTTRAN